MTFETPYLDDKGHSAAKKHTKFPLQTLPKYPQGAHLDTAGLGPEHLDALGPGHQFLGPGRSLHVPVRQSVIHIYIQSCPADPNNRKTTNLRVQ